MAGVRGDLVFVTSEKPCTSVHVALFIFFIAYIFIHAYLASLSAKPLAHYKGMITGYEEVD